MLLSTEGWYDGPFPLMRLCYTVRGGIPRDSSSRYSAEFLRKDPPHGGFTECSRNVHGG